METTLQSRSQVQEAVNSSTKCVNNKQRGNDDTSSAPVVLNSAPPPWHTVALLGIFVALFIQTLPSMESFDEIATIETFTNVVFPEFLSLRTLAWMRLGMAAMILTTSLYFIHISPGWYQQTAYLKTSKLKRVPNQLKGIKTMFPFTSLAWNLLGLEFLLTSYIAFQVARSQQDVTLSPSLLRSALVLWEIAAPFTLLVSATIRYAIWPVSLKSTGDTTNLKSWRNVLMHNLNVLFALTELALLGGLPVCANHVAFAPLVGCAYVVFSWCMTMRWNDAHKHGPQFIYFFLDTTLPGWTASLVLLVLLLVLISFYGLFCITEHLLEWIDGGWPVHVVFVAVVCSAVMRFRD